MRHRVFVAALLFLVGTGHASTAQDAPSPDTTAAPVFSSTTHVSLADWADRRHRLLLDRYHNRGARHTDTTQHYDRGAFRHLTPMMDREYALDMLAYRFPVREAYTWSRAGRGLRVRAGSIERTGWAFVSDFKDTIVLGGPHTLQFNARLQEDGRAERAFFELGYRYAINERHRIGVEHTFSQYKPDFDVTVFYQVRTATWGRARVDLTLSNAYNNFIYSTLGVSAQDQDILRIYESPPVVARLQASTPVWYPVRLEVQVGWRPRVAATFTSQTDTDFRYRDTEGAYFASVLASYSGRVGTVGVLYQRDHSSLDREGVRSGISSNYRTEQRLNRYGALAQGEWRNWRSDLWYTFEQYSDRQTGTDFTLSTVDGPLDYWEDRHTIQARIRYAPDRGVQAGIKYNAYIRSLDNEESQYLTRQWTGEYFSEGASNYRLTPLLGYQWLGGSVIGGVGFDLDRDDLPPGIPDSPGRFDNAYLRFTIYW